MKYFSDICIFIFIGILGFIFCVNCYIEGENDERRNNGN